MWGSDSLFSTSSAEVEQGRGYVRALASSERLFSSKTALPPGVSSLPTAMISLVTSLLNRSRKLSYRSSFSFLLLC